MLSAIQSPKDFVLRNSAAFFHNRRPKPWWMAELRFLFLLLVPLPLLPPSLSGTHLWSLWETTSSLCLPAGGPMFPCLGAAGHLFSSVYSQWEGPFLPHSCLFSSSEGDSKSEMILIKCFLYRNTHSTNLGLSNSLEVPFPTFSALGRVQTIDRSTKDKDKYLSGHKRWLEDLHLLAFIIVNV